MKALGFVYQPRIYGRPDFADRKNKIAVFVDGCFWHKCPDCFKEPKSNTEFWMNKIEKNVRRDRKVSYLLKKWGWKVIRIWEHDIKKLK